jgi:hypothetical protein
MRLPLRARAARLFVAAGLAASALLPGAAATVRAADPLVLKVGRTRTCRSSTRSTR